MAEKSGSGSKKQMCCSFCGKTEKQVNRLIASGRSNNIYICDECVDLCSDLLSEEYKDDLIEDIGINLITPKEIKEFLDEYVIGQDAAKKALSVAVYNHYKRITADSKLDVEIQKSNVLLIGPTGSGKTYLAQTLARIMNVPFAIADATTLTEAGYVGEDVENILLKLIQAADYDIERAEVGIVYIDEIDKITKKGENVSLTRDVSGEGVQQSLLKILEGTEARVPPQGGRKHPHQEFYRIDTTNILFICGGAFDGLEKIIGSRIGKKSIGFNAQIKSETEADIGELFAQVLPEDLVKFGIIPEMVGRVPVTVSLNSLDEETLIRILTEPKNAITKQYAKLLELDDIELEFDKEALNEIARETMQRKTGARGLRAIIENCMMEYMFELPSRDDIKKLTVTKDMVQKKDNSLLVDSSKVEKLEENTDDKKKPDSKSA